MDDNLKSLILHFTFAYLCYLRLIMKEEERGREEERKGKK